MNVMNENGPLQTPYVVRFDDYQGNAIVITVNFNNSTRSIQASSVTRDAACVYTKVFIGLGEDGTPNSTPKAFTVPAGTTAIGKAQFTNRGLDTIEDILALQITAG